MHEYLDRALAPSRAGGNVRHRFAFQLYRCQKGAARMGQLVQQAADIAPRCQRFAYVWVEQHLLPLAKLDSKAQQATLVNAWQELDRTERLVWNKLLTGAFRVGVSQTLVVRALAEIAGVTTAVISHRLMGTWEPTGEFFRQLIAQETADADLTRPYPFCLAHPLEGPPENLGPISAWQAEWKWDGIRAQIIRRAGTMSIWTRGEELVTERFPELGPAITRLPDGVVLDGEIVAWKDGQVLAFSVLQQRIGRKSVGRRILESAPVSFIAFDLLDHSGVDIRSQPLSQRRLALEALLQEPNERITLSSVLPTANWSWMRWIARVSKSNATVLCGGITCHA